MSFTTSSAILLHLVWGLVLESGRRTWEAHAAEDEIPVAARKLNAEAGGLNLSQPHENDRVRTKNPAL